jgi:hypothetical protein
MPMTTAKLRVAAWTLALGLTVPTAAWTTPAHAEAREHGTAAQEGDILGELASGVMSSFGSTARAAAPSPNVRVDPHSGAEIYVPTGETIDQVIEVVAKQGPMAVASIKQANPIELGLGMWTLSMSLSALFRLGMLAFGLLLFTLGAQRWLRARESLLASPLRALGTGALTMTAAVVSVIVLALTLVGIPLAAFVGLMAWFGLYVGQLVAALSLGSLLPASLRPRSHLGQAAAGALALWSISLLPGIGFIASLCASLLGLGACLVARANHPAPGFSGASLGV